MDTTTDHFTPLALRVRGNKIKNMKDKITKLTESEGVNVESDFHKDMLSIMESNNETIAKQFPEGSFGNN